MGARDYHKQDIDQAISKARMKWIQERHKNPPSEKMLTIQEANAIKDGSMCKNYSPLSALRMEYGREREQCEPFHGHRARATHPAMHATFKVQARCLMAVRVSRRPITVSARGAIGGGSTLFKDAPKDLLAPKQLPSGEGQSKN